MLHPSNLVNPNTVVKREIQSENENTLRHQLLDQNGLLLSQV
jgi:hypothetical protein